jgi:hypothetical protein
MGFMLDTDMRNKKRVAFMLKKSEAKMDEVVFAKRRNIMRQRRPIKEV